MTHSVLYKIIQTRKQLRKAQHDDDYNINFLADRTNGRAIATLLRLFVVVCRLSVCDVMYCG